MDTNLIAQIGVAVGTIVLAIATFVMAHQGKLQLKELKRQTQISSAKQEPILKGSNLKFTENKPRFLITNVGEGRAIWIGVSTQFHPSINKHPKIDAKFEWENKDAFSTEMINFPSKNGEIILDLKESVIYESEILFGISQKGIMGSVKGFHLNELKEFLKKYDIHEIAVEIGIIGKDLMEVSTPITKIASFFVDFEKHDTLEKAYDEFMKSGEKPYFLSLSMGEIRFTTGDVYRNLRSGKKADF